MLGIINCLFVARPYRHNTIVVEVICLNNSMLYTHPALFYLVIIVKPMFNTAPYGTTEYAICKLLAKNILPYGKNSAWRTILSTLSFLLPAQMSFNFIEYYIRISPYHQLHKYE